MISLDLDRLPETAKLGRALIDGLPGAGMVIVDRELHLLLLEGDAYADFDAGAMLGRPLSHTLTADAWKILEPRYAAALAGRTQAFEYGSSDGARVWSVRMSPIDDDADGHGVAGVLVLVDELTDRVAMETRAQAGERLQRSIIETLSEGVVVLGSTGELVQANEAARTLLGHPLDPADPDWWRLVDARHPDGTPLELASPGTSVVRSGTDLRDVPVDVRRADGERRLLRLNHRALRDDDGGHASAGLVVSFDDVTEREEERERLLATEARLRDAHELAGLSSWHLDVVRDRLTILQALPVRATPRWGRAGASRV